jgi:aminopeptidase N
MILDGLKDKFWHIRVLALGKAAELEGDYAVKGLEIVKGMIENDPKSDVRVAAVAAIGQLIEDNAALSALYNKRITEDRSYSVISIALSSLSGINPEEALAIAESLESEKSSTIIYGISQIYATHGGPDKFEFMKTALDGNVVGGFDKLGVMNSLTLFIARQDITMAEEAYPVYERLSETGGFYMTMFLPQALLYLNQYFDATLGTLDTELKGHIENKDALYADQTRVIIKAYKAQKEKYSALAEKMEKVSDK